jgi:uncharacterized protein YkwD
MSKYTTLAKQVFEEHNRVRTNPKSYIPFLEKELTYFKGDTMYRPGSNIGIITNEGKAAYHDCINFLKNAKPLHELKAEDGLDKAAQAHANDIGPKGITEHTGSDGSQMSDRIERYVDWNITCGENISFDCHTAEDILIQLMVDDGNLNRGHRTNIFSHKFNYIGVGCAAHTEYNICCVIDYVGDIIGKSSGGDKGGSKPYDIIYNMSNKNQQKRHDEYDDDEFDKIRNKIGFGFKNYDDDLGRDFAGKMNLKPTTVSSKPTPVSSKPTGKASSGFEDDPDAPANAVSCSIKTITKTVNGKVTKKTIKKYVLDDGAEETVEIEENY